MRNRKFYGRRTKYDVIAQKRAERLYGKIRPAPKPLNEAVLALVFTLIGALGATAIIKLLIVFSGG